jgi:transposase
MRSLKMSEHKEMAEKIKKHNNGTLQYKKELCQKLVDHMSQGHSFSTFSTIAGVTRTTLYDWVDKYKEFRDAKENGEEAAKKFLEKRLMAKISGQDLSKLGINTRNIDTTALIFALKTRFYKEYGDRQKVESTNTTEHKISIENQDEQL